MEQLSARASHGVLKLRRTIPLLGGSQTTQAAHLANVIQYQPRRQFSGKDEPPWLTAKQIPGEAKPCFGERQLGSRRPVGLICRDVLPRCAKEP